jgi:ribulose-phosphate 3-epimerase
MVYLILLMSVFPGFAGQSFVNGSMEKIAQTRKLLDKAQSKAMLGIDGGIKENNIGDVAHAGADFFVVGSGLFHTSDYQKTVAKLQNEIGKS